MPTASEKQAARDEATRALARSVLWQAVSWGLRPPDALVLARFAPGEALEALGEAAALAGGELAGCVARLGEVAAPAESEHAKLFGHTTRGQVPPYETEWGQEHLFLKPHELADLGGFLAAFRLTLNLETHERVDHLSVEAELMAFLAARRARALDEGDIDAAGATARAERLLLRDHLARFVPAFAAALAREAPGGFYGRLGRLALELVQTECAARSVPLGRAALALRPTDIDDEPLDCGSGCGLVQLESQARRAPAVDSP